MPTSWSNIEDPVVPLKRNPKMRKSSELGMCLLVHRKEGLFLSEDVDEIKMIGRTQNLSPLWKNLMKLVDLRELTSFFDHEHLGCTQRECKPNETIIDELENYLGGRNLPRKQ